MASRAGAARRSRPNGLASRRIERVACHLDYAGFYKGKCA